MTKDIVDYNKYKNITNVIRNNTRQLYKDEQNNIAKECYSLWNYINSKTKVTIRLTIFLITMIMV